MSTSKNTGKVDRSNQDKVKGVRRNLLALPDDEIREIGLGLEPGKSFGSISAKSLIGALRKEAKNGATSGKGTFVILVIDINEN